MWKKEADKNVWQLLKCYTWIVISFFICVWLSRTYFIVASRIVRPSQIYRVAVSILSSPISLSVRASILRNGVDIGSATQECKPGIPETLLIKVCLLFIIIHFSFPFLCIVCLFCVVGTCGVFEMIWSHHHHWPVFVFVFKTIDSEHNSSGPVPTTRRRQYGSCPGWYGFPQWNHIELFSTFHDDFHSNGKARLPSESNRYINYVTRNYFNTKKKTQNQKIKSFVFVFFFLFFFSSF